MFKAIILIIQLLLLSNLVAEEFHYIAKTSFKISGNQYDSKTGCEWQISGLVTMILSFSRTTSQAGMKVSHNAVSNTSECSNRTESNWYRLTLIVREDGKSFFAQTEDKKHVIKGTKDNLSASGSYDYLLNQDENQQLKWTGTFNTEIIQIPGEIIDVSDLKGNVITAMPLGASLVQDSIIDASTIITDSNAFVTLKEKIGSEVKLNPKTILTRLPVQTINNKDLKRFVMMRGKIESKVDNTERDFQIITPGVKIVVNPGFNNTISLNNISLNRNAQQITEFTTEYSQEGLQGNTSVSVESGVVVVQEKQGQKTVLTSGDEASYNNTISKTTWVQPGDGGYIYSNAENILAWAAYPEAASYIIEYNLPTPVFIEENSPKIEKELQTIHLTADMYTLYEGLVVYYIELGELPEQDIEARVYALDDQGVILSKTVSSDRITVGVK